MRNPLRLKNFGRRYLPWYALGAAVFLFSRPSTPAFVAGVVLVVLGASLRTWGAGHLVKNDELSISGPYAWVRHPLYAGTLLVGVGFGVIVGGRLSFVILPVLMVWFFASYFPRKERIESGRLTELYGEGFVAYRSSVPALLPAIRPWRPLHKLAGLGDPELRWSAERYSENNELGTLLALLAGVLAFGARTLIGS
jgi:protein-S-isoprenylcysteine O-methyltransferase Ste14